MNCADISEIGAFEAIFFGVSESANFQAIPEGTHFWMLRTQKGYFYREFTTQNFVALAWNLIDKATDFSAGNTEHLKSLLTQNYKRIGHATTAINKCYSFIYGVKCGDYILIPSESSRFVTIAIAGEYYENHAFTYQNECETIEKIQNGHPTVKEITCPYKKRRKITPLVSIPSKKLNYRLLRGISSYHGLSCLDEYAYEILSAVYHTYSFGEKSVISLWSAQTDPIGPRMLSGLLYHSTNYFCNFIEEDSMSTKVTLNSEGPIQFIFETLQTNFPTAAILFLVLISIAAISPNLEKLPDLLKGLFSIPADLYERYLTASHKAKELEASEKTTEQEQELRQLEIIGKKIELLEKLKASGISPEALEQDLVGIAKCSKGMKIIPPTELPAVTERDRASGNISTADSVPAGDQKDVQ